MTSEQHQKNKKRQHKRDIYIYRERGANRRQGQKAKRYKKTKRHTTTQLKLHAQTIQTNRDPKNEGEIERNRLRERERERDMDEREREKKKMTNKPRNTTQNHVHRNVFSSKVLISYYAFECFV